MMFNKNFKKDTVTFITIGNGLPELFPILPASKVKYDWAPRVLEDYKNFKKNLAPYDEFTHIRKCPGIFDLVGSGFVITQPWDVYISFETGRLEFKSVSKNRNYREQSLLKGKGYVNVQPNAPNTDKRTVLKLPTPWHVIPPAGVKMLMLPIPYPDDYTFEACPGILDTTITSELHVQVFWNKKEGHLIKAGTPLMQMIPLTEKKLNLEVRQATEKDLKMIDVENFRLSTTFQTDRNILKKFYKKFIKE